MRAREIGQLWKNLAAPVDFRFRLAIVVAPSASRDDLSVYPEKI